MNAPARRRLSAFALCAALPCAALAQGQPKPAAPPALPAPQTTATQAAPLPVPVPPGVTPITLEQAISLSLERNTDLVHTRLQSRQSEEDLITARSAILPRVDFNASASANRSGGGETTTVVDPTTGNNVVLVRQAQSFGNYNAGLSLRQLIFDGGKWWNNLAAADLGLAASKASIDEQRLQTAYSVERFFYELVRAQRQLAVFGEAAQRSRDQADYTQRLFEGGRATQADVYAARANRDNDEVNRLGAEARVEVAREDLAVGIGVDPSEPLAVAEPPALMNDPSVPPPAKEAVEKALSGRPSLKAFSLLAESQRKQAAAASGDYWPQVSLAGSYNRNSQAIGDIFDRPDKKNTLSGSVNITWNLFAGFSTDAAVRRAQAGVLLSENDLVAGRRGVASDVEKAVAQLSSARAQARVASQSEDTAREGLRLARTRQQVGVGTQLEVRDAELKLTQAQLSRINALVDGREFEAALRRAVGG